MQSLAEILQNYPSQQPAGHQAAYQAVQGRRQPKCRLIPPGARLIRIV